MLWWPLVLTHEEITEEKHCVLVAPQPMNEHRICLQKKKKKNVNSQKKLTVEPQYASIVLHLGGNSSLCETSEGLRGLASVH